MASAKYFASLVAVVLVSAVAADARRSQSVSEEPATVSSAARFDRVSHKGWQSPQSVKRISTATSDRADILTTVRPRRIGGPRKNNKNRKNKNRKNKNRKNKDRKNKNKKNKNKNKKNKKNKNKVRVNGKLLPKTCRCKREAPGDGHCYYYTENNSNYCDVRYCDAKYVCVEGRKKKGAMTCILRRVKSKIVPDGEYTCKTQKVDSYMYVPYEA